jgi:hypothetical protein
MGTLLAWAQAIPVGQCGVGEQDRPDRLGYDVEEGGLQSSLRFSGAEQRAIKVARAISVMMIFAAATRTPRGIARV